VLASKVTTLSSGAYANGGPPGNRPGVSSHRGMGFMPGALIEPCDVTIAHM